MFLLQRGLRRAVTELTWRADRAPGGAGPVGLVRREGPHRPLWLVTVAAGRPQSEPSAKPTRRAGRGGVGTDPGQQVRAGGSAGGGMQAVAHAPAGGRTDATGSPAVGDHAAPDRERGRGVGGPRVDGRAVVEEGATEPAAADGR